MTRLTEEMVIARSKQSDISSIKKLNCWGSDLTDVSIIRRMRDVEVLALSVNKITGLSDFENCHKLQELYLRKNNIKDINDLDYLRHLKKLEFLWLEENPCVDNAGPNYRKIVLRTLPNLKKLDNIEVTPEEVIEAINDVTLQSEAVVYDAYTNNQMQQQQQQVQQPPQNHAPVQSPQQSYRTQSPVRERSPPNQDYSPAEPNHPPPSSPKYNRDHRGSYHQSYDRSPGSDQNSPVAGCRERAPIVPSMSTHSMKEYYQSDRPTPGHYRHSQTDLTEWDEQNNNANNHNNSNGRDHHPHNAHHYHHQQQQHHHQQQQQQQQQHTPSQRRNGPDRDINSANYQYRNGSKEEWDDGDRPRRDARRSEGRFSDTASVVSSAVLNHYASFHRRPVNRSSNLLSATLCLVKELDYPSLEVVEHAVRCRIDELAVD